MRQLHAAASARQSIVANVRASFTLPGDIRAKNKQEESERKITSLSRYGRDFSEAD